MLELARRHLRAIGDRIGWHNVEFHRGHIQDLALDLDRLEAYLAEHPVSGVEGLARLRGEEHRLREEAPLVADASVDLVLSNCVLNLVVDGDKERLYAEIRRVLRPGGRCVIADIVSDEEVPERLKRDPELWSGCISGALREDRFVQAFADAGLLGARIVERAVEPWAVVEGIEFRSVTVEAWRMDDGPCLEHGDAVIYRGPWARVVDDEGHVFVRGGRTAICRRTAENLARGPYSDEFHAVPPLVELAPEAAVPFDCTPGRLRSPAETKRGALRGDVTPGCGPSCC
jgi:SAM-dependent methyltransferase